MDEREPKPLNRGLEAIARRLVALSDHERVSVAELLVGFGRVSFVPLLIVPAFIVVSPLSGIPFLPTTLGLVIGLIALQMAARRRHLWLPGFLQRRTLSGHRLARAVARARPVARWIDRHTRRRLGLFIVEPAATLARLACAACGLAMPFLELVPFSSSILAAAVLLFAVGFLAEDGLFIVLAVCLMAAAAAIPLVVIL